MIKRVALLVLILLMSFSTPALAAGEPVINGKVINGTSGGGPVGGLNVTLTTYINSVPLDEKTTSVDSDGNFQFAGLSTNETYAYDVSMTYEGVQYGSDVIQLTPDNSTQTANIQVYETTNDNAAVQMSTSHMIIVPSSLGVLTVLEIWIFNNAGDRTYVGAANAQSTAQFTLPAGVSDFSALDSGISGDMTTGIVTSTTPMIPGQSSVGFEYALSYQGSHVTITLKTDYPVPSLSVLVPQKGVVAKSKTLTQATPQDFNGTTYLNFTGSNIQKGQNLDISLDFSPSRPVPWLWVGVIALVVVGGGVFVYMMKKRTPQTLSIEGQIAQLRQQLLLDIAKLDDDFENGKIEKEAYTRLRAERKSQLVGLLQGSKEESGKE